jgi:hypothetical protein
LCRLQETAANDKQKKAGPCQSRPNLRRKEKRKLNLVSTLWKLPNAVDRPLAGRHAAAAILPHLAPPPELITKLTEFVQLFRVEYFTQLQFTAEPQFRDLRLGELEFPQPGGDVFFVEGVRVYRHVERSIGLAYAAACLFHEGATGLVHSADLLQLIGCETEFFQEVRPVVSHLPLGRGTFGRRVVLGDRWNGEQGRCGSRYEQCLWGKMLHIKSIELSRINVVEEVAQTKRFVAVLDVLAKCG